MIQKLNIFITKIFNLILYPFKSINEFWEILFLSLITSFIVLIVYKYVSSPKKIKEIKNKIKSNILAIRLYKDFFKVITGSFFKSFFYTLKYFCLNIGPVLIIIPILFPLFIQMDIRYGKRPFKSGENIVVKAEFNSNVFNLDIKLMENDLFKPKMNPVFINAFIDKKNKKPIREVNWKIKLLKEGVSKIKIQVGDKIFEKDLIIGNYRGTLSNKKLSRSSIQHIIYPAEGLLSETENLKSIYFKYPAKKISFFGLKAHWLVFNIIIVVIIALTFRKKFGVEF